MIKYKGVYVKIFLKLFSTVILIPIISSCSNEQINSAIEACKGDPTCYQIIDEAIVSELEARGITGGLMTNIEMNTLTSFLLGYTLGPSENQVTRNKIEEVFSKSFYMGFRDQNESVLLSLEDVLNDFMGMNNEILIPSTKIFDLEVINPDTKQLFYTGEAFNRTKHVIYKTGDGVYKYEVFGEEEFEFTIQVELNSIFFRNKRYISPKILVEHFSQYSWDSILNSIDNKVQNDSIEYYISNSSLTQGYVQYINGKYFYEPETEFQLDVPFFNYTYREYNSSLVCILGYEFSGNYDNFVQFVNISLFEYNPYSWNDYTYYFAYSYEVQSIHLEVTKTLFEWLEVFRYDVEYSLIVEGDYQETYFWQKVNEVFQPLISDSITFESIKY